MATYDQKLELILNRTSGFCHICWKKLSRKNYGKTGAHGAWEVEHSIPQCKGGTDHGNNLYAAHIVCNRKKGRMMTRTVRWWHGKTCALMSLGKRERAKEENTFLGVVLGGLTGLALGGPPGALIGAFSGGKIGRSLNPDKTG